MFRYVSIFLYLVLWPFALLADEVVDYLKQYEGRWVGHFTIHSGATGYSQTFPVEQRYWWKDGQLHGISVADTNDGMQMAKSRTFVQDGKLRSEVTRGEVNEVFFGVLHEDGIVWISSDLKRATDYQMREAFVVEEDGSRGLYTDGFDSYVYQEGLAHLIYRGRLLLQAEEPPSPTE